MMEIPVSSDGLIKNVGDLTDAARIFRNEGGWIYRGHSNLEWRLVPKVGRSHLLMEYESSHYNAWMRRAVEYVATTPKDDWDWLSIAQHHGFPTRFLDWSMNPLVAAFFAVIEENDGDARFYAFKPKRHILRDQVGPLSYTGVAAFSPSSFAPRISRQSSMFSVHGAPDMEITTSGEFGELREFVIPQENKLSIALDLDHFRVNFATLFPDLDGLALHMKWFVSTRELQREWKKKSAEAMDD